VNGIEISPLEFISNVLFKEWKLGDTEEEITVMRITLKGENEKGQAEEIVYRLYDEYNKETQTSSMARTTGYAAAACANMLIEGLFKGEGIFPPEKIGKDKPCFDYIMEYLEKRDIHYIKSQRKI
jgi:saccharopine dehydrogenase-like NADP-dependent oxidoreductase